MDIRVPNLISREHYVSMDIRVDGCKRQCFFIMDIRAQRLNSRKAYVSNDIRGCIKIDVNKVIVDSMFAWMSLPYA